MSIRVCVHNHDKQWVEMDRACFGFLSHIHCWDGSDVEDSSDNFTVDDEDYEEEGIEGFESGNLQSVDYIEGVHKDLLEQVKVAMAGLPQYYGNVTITSEKESYHSDDHRRVTFNILLGKDGEGLPMQPCIIGAMMLRNVLQYTSYTRAFEKLIKAGVPEPVAFVICQAYQYRQNGIRSDLSGFYRNYGGDDTIFKGDSRMCDLVLMIKGELGDNWQGGWGDTDNGYGRYGDYDGHNAPRSERTGYAKDLADVTLVTDREVWAASPHLNQVKDLGCGKRETNGYVFFTEEEMVKDFVPKLQELLK